jgi:hypothetical protein
LPAVEVASDGPMWVGEGVLPGTFCSDIAKKKLDCHYTLTPRPQAIGTPSVLGHGANNRVDMAKVAGETA